MERDGKGGRWREWVGPLVLLGVVLTLFWRPLVLSGRDGVVGAADGDIQQQFVPWREYAAERLSHGDVPLWNPYSFGGQPFVGGFQSAVFYPVNWVFLVLPVGLGITVVFGGHVYLAGLVMWGWMRWRGSSRAGALVAGSAFMLCAPVLGRAFPGHLTWVCVVAWMPGVFWCVEGLVASGRWRWVWVGSGLVALQVLAGYPQPVYITVVSAGVYLAGLLLWTKRRWRSVLGFGVMVGGGVVISAVQLWMGVEAAGESVRAGRTSLAFASSYAVPWVNWLLAVSPNALGGMSTGSYRGAWLPWEVTPYAGAAVAVLALVGVVCGSDRRRWAMVGVAVVCGVVAMGTGTPVFRGLYEVVPGMGSFRAPGRWLVVVAMGAGMLAAGGVDALRGGRGRVVALVGCGVVAAVLVGMGAGSTSFVTRAVWVSMVPVGLLGVAVAIAGKVKKPEIPIAVVALVELVLVGRGWVVVSKAHPAAPAGWVMPAGMTRDDRVAILGNRFLNLPMSARVPGVLGYDPFEPRRWAQFMAATQGRDPRGVDEIVGAEVAHPAWRVLRAGAVFGEDGSARRLEGALPRVLLVPRGEVVAEWSTRLARMMNPEFDFTKVVLLESAPKWKVGRELTDEQVAAEAGAELGTAEVVGPPGGDSDRMEIHVRAGKKCLLVVTDAYAKGWRAWRVDTGEELAVLPGDQVVRAVAVEAGNYSVVMEYRPRGWVIGRWVSVGGLVVWGAIGVGWVIRRSRARQVMGGETPITVV